MTPQNRLTVTLNLPNSVNGLYFVPPCPKCGYRGNRLRKNYQARSYTQREGEVVIWEARQQNFQPRNKRPYRVRANVWLVDKRSDMPNRIKHLLDTVLGALGIDDRYVAEVHIVACYDRGRPRVEIEVSEMGEWPSPQEFTQED